MTNKNKQEAVYDQNQIDLAPQAKSKLRKVFGWTLMILGGLVYVASKIIEHVFTHRPHDKTGVYRWYD
ncbi:MAG: hypothetical protein P8I03_14900 [Thalassotalea sp.]|nr:hypothetical protein [Thalassotalea sp.]